MEKALPSRFEMLLRILIFVLVMAIIAIILDAMPARTPSTASDQAKNEAAIKAVQPNDLVVCVATENGIEQVSRAILVTTRYNGVDFYGKTVNKGELREEKPHPIPFFSSCRVEVQRDVPAGTMPAHLGRILLYGLNPPPEHPIR